MSEENLHTPLDSSVVLAHYLHVIISAWYYIMQTYKLLCRSPSWPTVMREIDHRQKGNKTTDINLIKPGKSEFPVLRELTSETEISCLRPGINYYI